MNTLLRQVTETAKLVSLPDIYLQIKRILDSPDFTMAEVAAVISQDPAITLRLLRLVNSSLYAFPTKIETVHHAITLLGSQQIHDIVLTTAVTQSFQGLATDVMDMPKFWHQSIHCAVTARLLASQCTGCDKETLFVAGLLHDVGHLIMYQAIPELSQESIITANKSKQPLHIVEESILGFNYAHVGADLMRQWELSERLWETTRFHVEPEKAEKYPLETALIHLASLQLRNRDLAVSSAEKNIMVHPSAWQISGLTPDTCTGLEEQIEMQVKEVINLIFFSYS